MRLIKIASVKRSEVILVEASEVIDLVDWLRDKLAYLNWCFIKAEQESWPLVYLALYEVAVGQVIKLARMKCRRADVMARRGRMLARCDKELGRYMPGYLAAMTAQ